MMLLHQLQYQEMLLKRFQEDCPQPLREAQVPYILVEASLEEQVPGIFASSCRKHLGGLAYLLRCSRPDLANAVYVLCREVNRWSRASDHRLIRIFAYLLRTKTFGLVWWCEVGHAYDDTGLVGYCDSDHGGCVVSTRSTSGWLLAVADEEDSAWMLIDWNCRRQGATAFSTAEAEVVAITDSTIRTNLPCLELACIFRGYDSDDEDSREEDEPFLELRVDADAARVVVTGKNQTKLSHLKKHQRINLGVIRDAYVPRQRRLRRVDGKFNRVDGLTKGMKDHQAFLDHRKSMGVRDLTDLLKEVRPMEPLPKRPGLKETLRKAGGAILGAVPAVVGAVLSDDGFKKEAVRWAVGKVFSRGT